MDPETAVRKTSDGEEREWEQKNLTAEERKKQIEEAEKNVKAMDDFTSPEKLYDELIASVRKYHPSDDISMIEKAYQIAKNAHEGQLSKVRGTIYHPSAVCGDHSGGSGAG